MNTFPSSEPILLFSSTAISLVAGPIRFKVVPLFRLLTASTNSYIPFVGTRFPINAILLYVRGDKSTSVITFIKLGAICTFPFNFGIEFRKSEDIESSTKIISYNGRVFFSSRDSNPLSDNHLLYSHNDNAIYSLSCISWQV